MPPFAVVFCLYSTGTTAGMSLFIERRGGGVKKERTGKVGNLINGLPEKCKNNYVAVPVLLYTVVILTSPRNPVIVLPYLSQGTERCKRTVLHLTIPQVDFPRSRC